MSSSDNTGFTTEEFPEMKITPDDIKFVCKQLYKYSHKWQDIGLALYFEKYELKNIELSSSTKDPYHLLHDLLNEWAQWPTTNHQYTPTLKRLCNALRSDPVKLGTTANSLRDSFLRYE